MAGCASRSFPRSTASDLNSKEQVYKISSQGVWHRALVVKVLDADKFVIRAPKLQGEQTVQVFGVKRVAALTEVQGREFLRQKVKGGDQIDIEQVASGQHGQMIARVFDARGSNVGVWLSSVGAVLPFAICRPVDKCSQNVLKSKELDAVARVCEGRVQEQKLLNVANQNSFDSSKEPDLAVHLGLQSQIAWVGNLKTMQYVPMSRRDEIPVCQRVFFSSAGVDATNGKPPCCRDSAWVGDPFSKAGSRQSTPAKNGFSLKSEN